jgi:hypothetical protein
MYLLKSAVRGASQWYQFYAPATGPPIVCFYWLVKATFQEIMELRRFPFDSQEYALTSRRRLTFDCRSTDRLAASLVAWLTAWLSA